MGDAVGRRRKTQRRRDRLAGPPRGSAGDLLRAEPSLSYIAPIFLAADIDTAVGGEVQGLRRRQLRRRQNLKPDLVVLRMNTSISRKGAVLKGYPPSLIA
jgi:hypothetical protein